MTQDRSLSVLLSVTGAVFLILPFALTSYFGSQRVQVDIPAIHTSHSGPEWEVSPISDRKAQAVVSFKTTQI